MITGDGDGLSIGGNHLMHLLRRNVNVNAMLFNNRIYGLTKGQFSASADLGSLPKKGDPNEFSPIDPVAFALSVGATFIARSFSGDRKQLVSLIKAGLKHKGFAIIDVISPCVSFNDHKGSTKSYAHTYEFYSKAVHADYIAPSQEIVAAYDEGEVMPVELHDGGYIQLRKIDADYDPTDRGAAFSRVMASDSANEILTGLLYIDESQPDLHETQNMEARPLNEIPYTELNPGAEALSALQAEFR